MKIMKNGTTLTKLWQKFTPWKVHHYSFSKITNHWLDTLVKGLCPWVRKSRGKLGRAESMHKLQLEVQLKTRFLWQGLIIAILFFCKEIERCGKCCNVSNSVLEEWGYKAGEVEHKANSLTVTVSLSQCSLINFFCLYSIVFCFVLPI